MSKYWRAKFTGRSFLINNALIHWDGEYLGFHDLNPEVRMKNRVSRWGLLKLSLWCAWQAVS